MMVQRRLCLVVVMMVILAVDVAFLQRRCPDKCSTQYDPVCGSNGVTYNNTCSLNLARCQDRSIRRAYRGECERNNSTSQCPDACPLFYDPVCGSDGKTYGNGCLLGLATCRNSTITFKHEGECKEECPVLCTLEYGPLCGSDGVTYGNPCFLRVAQCRNPCLRLAYPGECDPDLEEECSQVCTKEYAPVCGSDGMTYSNNCTLGVAQCRDPSIELAYPGVCD